MSQGRGQRWRTKSHSTPRAMDPWIVFDSRKTPRAEFDGWLETNKPSQVGRFGDEEGGKGPVGWISVLVLDHCPATGDITGLQESWESLLDSGRHVTFQIVKELALNHRVLTGKGLMHLDSGFKVDHACECVARAAVEGKISLTKVNPCDPKSDSKYVICSYNKDFMDKNRGDEAGRSHPGHGGQVPAVFQAGCLHLSGHRVLVSSSSVCLGMCFRLLSC